MHDRALQHHCARADIVEAPIVIEGEHARRDQHELEAAWWKMQMEVGRAGVFAINRQIGRDLMEEEGFVVGVKALIGAAIKCLRAIGRLVCRVLVPIDRYEIPMIQAERVAVRVLKPRPFEVDRSMYIHGILQRV